MCDNQSPARRNNPANDNPQGSFYHAGFRSATPMGAGGSSAIPNITGWPRQISWREFDELSQRPADESEDAYIEYNMDLSYGWTMDGGQALLDSIDITVRFDSNASWVVGSQKDATLLSHEQGHYDITGLCYRRMGRELSALRAGTGEALDSEVASIKQTANRGAKQLNTRYDNVIRYRPRFMGKKCVVINEVSSDWFALKELLHNY